MYSHDVQPRSISVHRRHCLGPLGDLTNLKVRMSNLIVRNLCTCLRFLVEEGRVFYLVIEQPSSSWMFKLEWMLALGAMLQCVMITTWMAFFNHDMQKPTHLWGTLPGLGRMSRTMTADHKAKFRKRLAARLNLEICSKREISYEILDILLTILFYF